MSVTPSYVLGARAVPTIPGQLDMFEVQEEAPPAPGDSPEDRCPADCPCYSMTPDTTDQSTTDSERTDR